MIYNLQDSYNPKYIIQYNNLIQELNKHKRKYNDKIIIAIPKKEVLYANLFTFNENNMIDFIKYDNFVDSIDILNFIKEVYYYNDILNVLLYKGVDPTC